MSKKLSNNQFLLKQIIQQEFAIFCTFNKTNFISYGIMNKNDKGYSMFSQKERKYLLWNVKMHGNPAMKQSSHR